MPDLTPVSEDASWSAIRDGSPVVNEAGRRGVVAWVREGSWCVVWDKRGPCTYRGGGHPVDGGWRLDPTDATGRAHLAWAVVERLPFAAPRTIVGWMYSDSGWSAWQLLGSANQWPEGRSIVADLDPNDPTTLPDGSRWVDCEALIRVANHVLVKP